MRSPSCRSRSASTDARIALSAGGSPPAEDREPEEWFLAEGSVAKGLLADSGRTDTRCRHGRGRVQRFWKEIAGSVPEFPRGPGSGALERGADRKGRCDGRNRPRREGVSPSGRLRPKRRELPVCARARAESSVLEIFLNRIDRRTTPRQRPNWPPVRVVPNLLGSGNL